MLSSYSSRSYPFIHCPLRPLVCHKYVLFINRCESNSYRMSIIYIMYTGAGMFINSKIVTSCFGKYHIHSISIATCIASSIYYSSARITFVVANVDASNRDSEISAHSKTHHNFRRLWRGVRIITIICLHLYANNKYHEILLPEMQWIFFL